MLKKNTILLFAFMAITVSVNAQIRPGIKLGYNFSGFIADYRGDKTPEELRKIAGDPDNFKMRSGFQGGLIVDCPINDTWAIQPGARFAMQGFKDKYTSNGDVIRKFSLFYLQVPVNVQYRLNVYEDTNVLFQAGPYGGMGLFGRQSFQRNGKSQDMNDTQKKITFGADNDIKQAFDYGIGAGVGIEYNRFQLMLAYDFGLVQPTFYKRDAKSATYNVGLRNHNFSVTLAVVFGRRDPLQNQRD